MSSARSLPLADIASIRGGLPTVDMLLRGRDRAAGLGAVRVLQSRDLAPDGSVAWAALPLASADRGSERFLIYEGDILLPLRSARPRALVARGLPEAVTAVGQWALITPNADLLESDYLAWLLNHPVTAARLGRVMKGGTLPFLPLTEIRAFEIRVPSLEIQRRIVQVDALHTRLARLERELADARTVLVNAATMNAVQHAAASPSATHS